MHKFSKIIFLVSVLCAAIAIASPAQTFETPLVSFNGTNAGGSLPQAGLVQGTDGNFYGTTTGPHFGTVFKMTPSGTLTTLYSFCSQNGCTDGTVPQAVLVQGTDGNFYGTTAIGGANGYGTVFKMTPSGTLTTLYSFCPQTGCTDGKNPQAGLVQGTDGNFYGTTASGGGANNYGTVFKITPSGTLTSLYSFCSQSGCTDGVIPVAGLVQGTDGNFYGTTYYGGAGGANNVLPPGAAPGDGTVFKITPSGTLTTLYSFCPQTGCTDGKNPQAGLVQGTDGNFYGTTSEGGANNYGTVFKITPSGTLTTLYSFCSQGGCTDGEAPYAGLIQGTDGNFYGTTLVAGANNYGTAFKITPSGTLTTLYSFCSQSGCTDGGYVYAGLVQGTDGNFYGTTEIGGANNDGTVYTLSASPPTGPVITSASSATFTVLAPGSFMFTTTGYPTPALSELGALPSGVTFTDNGNGTGSLAGTPASGTAGTYPITITATNSAGSNPQSFTLTVDVAVAFTSGTSTTFTVGNAASFTVTTVGTPTPALSEIGSLPSGVTFVDNGDGTGTLSGTPASGTTGSYPITFTASNTVSSATQNFTLTVNQGPAITSGSATTFAVGTAGSFLVTATGTPTPALSENGTLPAGVTFVDNGNGTAALSGTPAAGSGGSYPLLITAANGVGTNATQSFTVTINQGLAITSGSMTTFTVGSTGFFSVTTTGFPVPALTETGSLPNGVTFTDNGNGTATLSGTPVADSGGTYPLTITASNGGVDPNAIQSFTLVVNQGAAILTGNSTTFTVGVAGSFTLSTTGIPVPVLSETGALPGGVTFVDNGNGMGTLSGTPVSGSGGSYAITFTANNGVGTAAMQSFTLMVNQGPAITSTNTATFTQQVAGSFTVTTTGDPTPALSETGSLPSGVTFVDNGNGTATLSGTPAAGTAGQYGFTIQASNGVSPNPTQTFTLTVNAANQAPAITSASSTSFTVDVTGSFTVTATGVPTPTIAESGTLPSGVTFNATTNVLSGTPAAGTKGTYKITFTASNGVGSNAVQHFTLMVVNPAAPTLTSITPNTGLRGTNVPVTLTGTNFTSTGMTVTVSGSGVKVGTTTVVNSTTITTTFEISDTAGLTARTIKVTTAGGASNTETFTVLGPTLTSISPDTGEQTTSFLVTLTGTGLTGATAINVSGSGVSSSGLTVVNTSTVTATFTITATAGLTTRNVSVTTLIGTTNTTTFTVVAPPAPTLTSVSPNTGVRGTAVPVTLTGTDFTATGASVAVSGTGVTVSGLTVVNDTTITATFTITATAGLTARNVSVKTPGGTTSAQTFTVLGPTLASVAPNPAAAGSGIVLTLTGTNLEGATAVTLSGTGSTCTVNESTSTTVTATCTLTAGTKTVKVTTPIGTTGTVSLTVS
jgi:large repetitive protein